MSDGQVAVTENAVQVPVPVPAPVPVTKRYFATIHPGPGTEVDPQVASLVKGLESQLDISIWLLVQDGESKNEFSEIEYSVLSGFRKHASELENKKPVGLLIESPGGNAHAAYHIVRFFQRRSKHLMVIVPRYAKSAATLMALGATELLMGKDAELGPLDVQMFDPEREEYGSALNAVQSLERLNAFSMSAIDQLMPLLIRRTGRKLDTLLPLVLNYVVTFVKPLSEKIDAVDYTKKSRELKVAEQYAMRLMKKQYGWTRAETVARALVEKFPTHGFVIDRDEASALEQVGDSDQFGLGLKLKMPSAEVEDILDKLASVIGGATIIGQLKEMP